MPYQYGNPHNPQAHSKSTANEIMMDSPNGPDVLVTAVSTGGGGIKGILLGGPTGASLFIAINQATREAPMKIVLTVSADRGEKYLNEIYDNKWMLKKELTIDSNISEMISQAKAMKPFRYPSLETGKGVAA